MVFTYKERTIKNRTAKEAFDHASQVVRTQYPGMLIFVNEIRKYPDPDKKITLKEMSDIVDTVIYDSVNYNNGVRR